MGFQCSAERPWGIHPIVRNDQDCPRCGWVAPGPVGDARADQEVLQEVMAAAAERGWVVHEGGQGPADGQPFAPAYLVDLEALRLNGTA
jgi:hypothetical protein